MNSLYYSIIILWIFIFKGLHSKPLIGELVRNAYPEEFPFIVSIGHLFYLGCGINHFCGGSLITDKHILTAAHCIENLNFDEIQISIGTTKAEYGRIERLSSMITYAEWAKSRHMVKNEDDDDDVAILTLKRSVAGLKIPLPIISEIEDTEYYGKEVMTAGWGTFKTMNGEYETPRDLKTITLELWDREQCTNHIKELRDNKESRLPPQWLCTTSPKKNVLGSGDSGGPLLYQKNIIIAVNAATCPKSKSQDDLCIQNVYMSIQYVKEFIDDIIKQ